MCSGTWQNGSAVVPDKITRTVDLTGCDTQVTWTCGSVKPCSTLTSRKLGLEDNWHGYSSLADILLRYNYSSCTRPSEVQSAAVLVITCHNGDYFSTNFMYRKNLKNTKKKSCRYCCHLWSRPRTLQTTHVYLSFRQSGNYPPIMYTES